jgi:Fic family protein
LHDPAFQAYLAQANREYYHWEKLRHRPVPSGLQPEEAWQLVKWSRLGQMRRLPLEDEKGQSFGYWLPNSALEILHEVDRWGGTAVALTEGGAPGLGALRDRVIISSLMEEAIATSQIEGAVTTRKAAKEMLRTNRRPRNRSEQMILNSYRTIQLLRQRLDRPLSLDLLFEIQESMTRGTLDDPTAAGRFRTPEDSISIVDVRDNEVVLVPPPADQLPRRMARLIDFANAPAEKESFIHPLVKAAILHFWLAYEHPYVDGNGRTARALLYWLMLKRGYWLFEFLTLSRVIVAAPAQYYRSFLYSEHDDNDATYSLVYQLRATQRALANLRAYLAEKQTEQRQLAAALRQFPGLNHRQRALLEHALHHPAQVYTFQSHQNSHGITYVTARADLLGLLRHGLLTETRQGKQRGFLAAEDLAKKLEPEGKSPNRPRRAPAARGDPGAQAD